MTTTLRLGALAAALALAAPAAAEDVTKSLGDAGATLAAAGATHGVSERDVRFEVEGQTVVGTLALPEGVAEPPVVLLLHGFTGSRHELGIKDIEEGVFSRTARRLGEQGIASLRIDFRGSGESDGAWPDTTFSSQIVDAIAAVGYLRGLDGVDGANVHMLGWSQGGLVAASAAAETDVASTVLWAPVTTPGVTYPGLLGMDASKLALESDPATPISAKLPWGAETTLNAAFYNEVWTTSPLAKVTGYGGPLLVIVGTRDTTVWPQPLAGQAYLAAHDGDEGIMVLDTDHVFDAFVGPDTVDKMAHATAAWIKG